MSNEITISFAEALSRFLTAINKATEEHAKEFCDSMEYSDTDEEAYFQPVTVMQGRKYLRVVTNNGNSRSVYCFINRETGDILKAAGWASPAKGKRGSIFNPDQWENKGTLLAYGGWLYA